MTRLTWSYLTWQREQRRRAAIRRRIVQGGILGALAAAIAAIALGAHP